MARFLVTYHGQGMPSHPVLQEQAKAAFGAWLAEAGSSVVDPGAPVRAVTQVPAGTSAGTVDVAGYSIIEAATPYAAAQVLADHPFVGRGGTLQVNEIIAVP